MTVDTIFANTNDGRIESDDATYGTMRTGSSLVATTTDTSLNVTQYLFIGTYTGFEYFCAFDTSPVGTDAISVATLSLFENGASGFATQAQTIEARQHTWTPALTTGQWVSAANLGNDTLVASLASGSWSANAYNALTSQAAFLSSINGSGSTYLDVAVAEMRTGSTPGNGLQQGFSFYVADRTGTTNDPKLVITHAAAVANFKPTIVLQAVNRASTY